MSEIPDKVNVLGDKLARCEVNECRYCRKSSKTGI